jgi:hypothetical protein
MDSLMSHLKSKWVLREIVLALISINVCACSSFWPEPEKPNSDPPKIAGYSKESVKSFIDDAVKNHFAGRTDRDAFRNQIKVLAITACIGIIGLSLGKTDRKNKLLGLAIVFFLDISLYCLDTSMLDLNNRQTTFIGKLVEYQLKWDTMDMGQVDSALTTTRRGVESSNPYEKIQLALKPRANDWFWYGLPLALILFMKLLEMVKWLWKWPRPHKEAKQYW